MLTVGVALVAADCWATHHEGLEIGPAMHPAMMQHFPRGRHDDDRLRRWQRCLEGWKFFA